MSDIKLAVGASMILTVFIAVFFISVSMIGIAATVGVFVTVAAVVAWIGIGVYFLASGLCEVEVGENERD